MGEIVWNPGRLPRGPALVPAGNGIAVRLEVVDPNEEKIDWEANPFSVQLR